MTTPRYLIRPALEALAELAELMPADDLTFYAAQALNLHHEDVADDPTICGYLAQLQYDIDGNQSAVIDNLLAYVYPTI